MRAKHCPDPTCGRRLTPAIEYQTEQPIWWCAHCGRACPRLVVVRPPDPPIPEEEIPF